MDVQINSYHMLQSRYLPVSDILFPLTDHKSDWPSDHCCIQMPSAYFPAKILLFFPSSNYDLPKASLFLMKFLFLPMLFCIQNNDPWYFHSHKLILQMQYLYVLFPTHTLSLYTSRYNLQTHMEYYVPQNPAGQPVLLFLLQASVYTVL